MSQVSLPDSPKVAPVGDLPEAAPIEDLPTEIWQPIIRQAVMPMHQLSKDRPTDHLHALLAIASVSCMFRDIVAELLDQWYQAIHADGVYLPRWLGKRMPSLAGCYSCVVGTDDDSSDAQEMVIENGSEWTIRVYRSADQLSKEFQIDVHRSPAASFLGVADVIEIGGRLVSREQAMRDPVVRIAVTICFANLANTISASCHGHTKVTSANDVHLSIYRGRVAWMIRTIVPFLPLSVESLQLIPDQTGTYWYRPKFDGIDVFISSIIGSV